MFFSAIIVVTVYLFLFEICCPLPVVSHNGVIFDSGQISNTGDLKEKNDYIQGKNLSVTMLSIEVIPPQNSLSINIHHLGFCYINANGVSVYSFHFAALLKYVAMSRKFPSSSWSFFTVEKGGLEK